MLQSIIRISKAVAVGAAGIQAIGLVIVGGPITLIPAAVAVGAVMVAVLPESDPNSAFESYDDMGGGSL